MSMSDSSDESDCFEQPQRNSFVERRLQRIQSFKQEVLHSDDQSNDDDDSLDDSKLINPKESVPISTSVPLPSKPPAITIAQTTEVPALTAVIAAPIISQRNEITSLDYSDERCLTAQQGNTCRSSSKPSPRAFPLSPISDNLTSLSDQKPNGIFSPIQETPLAGGQVLSGLRIGEQLNQNEQNSDYAMRRKSHENAYSTLQNNNSKTSKEFIPPSFNILSKKQSNSSIRDKDALYLNKDIPPLNSDRKLPPSFPSRDSRLASYLANGGHSADKYSKDFLADLDSNRKFSRKPSSAASSYEPRNDFLRSLTPQSSNQQQQQQQRLQTWSDSQQHQEKEQNFRIIQLEEKVRHYKKQIETLETKCKQIQDSKVAEEQYSSELLQRTEKLLASYTTLKSTNSDLKNQVEDLIENNRILAKQLLEMQQSNQRLQLQSEQKEKEIQFAKGNKFGGISDSNDSEIKLFLKQQDDVIQKLSDEIMKKKHIIKEVTHQIQRLKGVLSSSPDQEQFTGSTIDLQDYQQIESVVSAAEKTVKECYKYKEFARTFKENVRKIGGSELPSNPTLRECQRYFTSIYDEYLSMRIPVEEAKASWEILCRILNVSSDREVIQKVEYLATELRNRKHQEEQNHFVRRSSPVFLDHAGIDNRVANERAVTSSSAYSSINSRSQPSPQQRRGPSNNSYTNLSSSQQQDFNQKYMSHHILNNGGTSNYSRMN